ncbi:hypothetical protein CWB99_03005 [Pseudoalteromonas rubra]|uniref:IPTL-CTERM protein sorting domain-containing protein n=1 Tax=Pseudoalteromonas rubra TaxID=43658 RepID=A0A5S3WSC3_9GAMM|nr:hypothetical protein [Pseudoalteromonas rubra]TMP30185.1 hypothetical protein CWC00_17480 [Pseudoalteromonas rubra]TMP31946.1 hypothetical protein CWB99_03005 [Pseudoalteromonas rubra]
MQCIYLRADGTVSATSETLEQCTGYVLVPAADAQALTASYQITSLGITEAFTWGFGVVVMLGFLSYKVRAARAVIKMI